MRVSPAADGCRCASLRSDPFYSESITRGLFDTFVRAGGKGEYVFVANHALPSGHAVGQAPELWEREVGYFLARLRF